MLKPDSPVPLYYQLQEHLREKIDNGELQPDTPLPTEAQLSQTYGVSRATVREALRSLVELGLVEKRQGVGSFVSQRKLDEKLPGLNSFSKEMSSHGRDVRSEVLNKEYMPAPRRVAQAFDIEEGASVLSVKRLRYVDGKPILVSTSFLPAFVSIENDFSQSIYEIFKENYELEIVQGLATIESGLAGDELAKLLNIEVGDHVLKVIWQAQTSDERCVEYSEGTYRGDSYRYIVQVKR